MILMPTLNTNQIRLRTGGYRNKSGKIVGGYKLPSDVKKDVRAGLIDVVPRGKYGIAIKATKKGKKVISARLKRNGML